MPTTTNTATVETSAPKVPVVPPLPRGPLTGVTVIDLTRVLAGPYCTMVLADLGARVIKVETPKGGDDSRAFGPFLKGQSAYFGSLNRGKESIALDLKKPSDKVIFEKLLARADVLVENFRPGTMEKLGFGWDTLHASFPRLIYAAASGFGHTGPYSKRAAYDMVVQAMGGIMSVTGHAGQPPVRVGSSIGDITAGLFTTIGVNAALLHRANTGEAIKVDVAMLDCQVAILENAIARYAATGEVAGPIGARHPSITPFSAFEAKDGWVVIAAGNDQLFAKACDVIGAPQLATDARFKTNVQRTENQATLAGLIGDRIAKRPVADWLKLFDAAGVPTGPINKVDQVLADPHVRSRNMVVTATDAEAGPLTMAGNPIKLSTFADPDTRVAAPRLDANRQAILKELAASDNLPAVIAGGASVANTLGLGAAVGVAYRAPLQFLDYLRHAILSDGGPSVAVSQDASLSERAKVLADALLSERGEVLGTVIAHDLVRLVKSAGGAELFEIFEMLAHRYAPDSKKLTKAADRWRSDPSPANLSALTQATEAPRQELFRRMNMAPDGTATLVKFREQLLQQLPDHPELAGVDADLKHLFASWFNRGFLTLERISWHTPAAVLEKLIAYEAVHAIDGWDDLRRRLASDRRCFGFFHPALPDEPLIFVEVALVNALADRIEPIIRAPMPAADLGTPHADTAIFYSISNCQPGLRGVSFGNFLIKQVATDLARELPSLKTFSTLSPMPRFRNWLEKPATELSKHLPKQLIDAVIAETGAASLSVGLRNLAAAAEAEGYVRSSLLKDVLTRLAARYLAGADEKTGPTDPVARFHLGNGARIEQVNWMADLSKKGVRESHGLMVNYLYDLGSVEKNHEAFANQKPIATSKAVAALIDVSGAKIKSRVDAAVDAALDLTRGRLTRK
jgi:CoA:oxalate CoA-transferase